MESKRLCESLNHKQGVLAYMFSLIIWTLRVKPSKKNHRSYDHSLHILRITPCRLFQTFKTGENRVECLKQQKRPKEKKPTSDFRAKGECNVVYLFTSLSC